MPCTQVSYRRRVELHETDLGHHVHHPNYFIWMEEAEYRLFDVIGEPVVGELDENLLSSGWPRAEVQMKFLKPARFRDQIEVKLRIKRIRAAAIEYSCEIFRVDSKNQPELIAVGGYSAICCLYDARMVSDPKVIEIPVSFRNKIDVDNIPNSIL